MPQQKKWAKWEDLPKLMAEKQAAQNVMIMIHDLPDPSNPGKSYRESNLENQHAFRVGDLVEITGDDEDYDTGVRLWVYELRRDCDGTPLYVLGVKEGIGGAVPIMYGYGEESLLLVRRPERKGQWIVNSYGYSKFPNGYGTCLVKDTEGNEFLAFWESQERTFKQERYIGGLICAWWDGEF